METKTKHECCNHGNGIDDRYCCKCKFGVRKGPSLPHGNGFYCDFCKVTHGGSRMLDGCPNWLEAFDQALSDAAFTKND